MCVCVQAAGFSGDAKVSGPYVFVSMPMFCGADEALAADAGLTCDMDKHLTWVDVEPTTGKRKEGEGGEGQGEGEGKEEGQVPGM